MVHPKMPVLLWFGVTGSGQTRRHQRRTDGIGIWSKQQHLGSSDVHLDITDTQHGGIPSSSLQEGPFFQKLGDWQKLFLLKFRF